MALTRRSLLSGFSALGGATALRFAGGGLAGGLSGTAISSALAKDPGYTIGDEDRKSGV